MMAETVERVRVVVADDHWVVRQGLRMFLRGIASLSDRRDLAILAVFGNMGLRAAECCGLDVEDIDLDESVLRVRKSKGGKWRILSIIDPDPSATAGKSSARWPTICATESGPSGPVAHLPCGSRRRATACRATRCATRSAACAMRRGSTVTGPRAPSAARISPSSTATNRPHYRSWLSVWAGRPNRWPGFTREMSTSSWRDASPLPAYEQALAGRGVAPRADIGKMESLSDVVRRLLARLFGPRAFPACVCGHDRDDHIDTLGCFVSDERGDCTCTYYEPRR